MQQLIYFLQKYKYFLYFLLLQFIAIILIFNNHSYHRSKFVSSTNAISGSYYTKKTNLSNYFLLKEDNLKLIEENTKLKNELEAIRSQNDTVIETNIIDSVKYHQKYVYINGNIIKNEYRNPYNILTVKPGSKQGVTKEMGVINHKGIIGITDNVSNNYARVKSILNKDVTINARFKHSAHYGYLKWDGNNYNTIQLTDIPREATYKIGDTIITDGKSAIFPEGILIGTVYKLPKELTASNSIDVKLFNDMTNINHIYVIKNLHKFEIKKLEENTNEQ